MARATCEYHELVGIDKREIICTGCQLGPDELFEAEYIRATTLARFRVVDRILGDDAWKYDHDSPFYDFLRFLDSEIAILEHRED